MVREFNFSISSRVDVLDTGDTCLIFTSPQFNGFSVQAQYIFRHTMQPSNNAVVESPIAMLLRRN